MAVPHSNSIADLDLPNRLPRIPIQPSFSDVFSSVPGSTCLAPSASKDSTSESSSEEDTERHLVFRVMNPDAEREARERQGASLKTEREQLANEQGLSRENGLAVPYLAEPPHTHSNALDEDTASVAPATPSLVRKQSKTLAGELAPTDGTMFYGSADMEGLLTHQTPSTALMNRMGIPPAAWSPRMPFSTKYPTDPMNNESKKIEALSRSSSSAGTGMTALVSHDNYSTNSTSTASRQDTEPPIRTSTAGARFENAKYPSKYAKASYSLTHNPDAIKVYRDMAEKTKDPLVQLAYAKYLLDVAGLYDPDRHKRQALTNHKDKKGKSAADSDSNSGLFSAPCSPLLRPISYLDHVRPSFDSHYTTTIDEDAVDPEEDADNRRKRKHLEDEGIRWIRKLAKQDVGEAAYLKAKWMEESLYGFKNDPAKTLKLYTVGAKAGIPEAMYALGERYERDGKYGQAFDNYRDAASQHLVEATFRLATVYLHGELHQCQSMKAGLDHLLSASKNAKTECNEPPYLFALVLTNEYPKAEIPDEMIQLYGGSSSAVAHFERAAELGNLEAQSRIASIYERGEYGAPVNFAKAFGYYVLAAKQGNATAMLGLSRLYNRGSTGPGDHGEEDRLARDESGWLQMTTRNEDTAFMWCQKAALQDFADALYLLGWYYESGIGAPRDDLRAKENYQKAATKGHQGAEKKLAMYNSTTEQQLSGAGRNTRQTSRSNCRPKKKILNLCIVM